MASNTKMPPLMEEALKKEGSEIGPDSPLLDLSDAASDDNDNWLSVATIEAELKPKVIEAFDTIAGS
jgi:RNA polymerase primary sigma factor